MFRTLYGDVELDSPRLHRCPCQGANGPATVSPPRDLISSHVGRFDVFAEANGFIGDGGYEMVVVGPNRLPVRASIGMTMAAELSFADATTVFRIVP